MRSVCRNAPRGVSKQKNIIIITKKDAPQRKRGRALCGDAPRALVVSAPDKAPRKPRRGAVGKGVEEKEAAFVAGRVTLKARREEEKA